MQKNGIGKNTRFNSECDIRRHCDVSGDGRAVVHIHPEVVAHMVGTEVVGYLKKT